MGRKRVVIVGNGGVDSKGNCFLSDNSDVVDSADEVIRFQGCQNYHTNMVGTKTTQLVMRDVFDPHTTRVIGNNAKFPIPDDVLKQIRQWYIILSGAHIYEKPVYYAKTHYSDVDEHPYYKDPVYDEREFYDTVGDTSPYYDRYPQLLDLPVTFIHQHDTIQFYRQTTTTLIPSAGFIWIYYLMYYTSIALQCDVELVAFTWSISGHEFNIEKQFIQKMSDANLIAKVHNDKR